MNNKHEAIQLLNASSDSDSASDIQFSLAPQPAVEIRRKIRTKRKSRKDGHSSASNSGALPCSLFSVLKVAVVVFTLGGTLILGWVVMLLHSELQQLSEKLANIPTTNDDEVLLGLKRSIKELSQNQTFIFATLQNYSRVMDDFQSQTTAITTDVSSIKDSLKEAPQMLNIGKELDSLKSSLAAYEASVSDLKISLNDIKDTSSSSLAAFNSTLHSRIDSVIENIHQHDGIISALKNVTEQLSAQNPTLTRRIEDVQLNVMKLASQQKNTTVTLSSAMQIIQSMDDYMAKHPDHH